MRICTVIARNYAAQARVLAKSLASSMPGTALSVLVLDGPLPDLAPKGLAVETIEPSDLRVTTREFHRMAAIYDVTELATALKPWLLERMLDHGDEVAMYLDPDTWVQGSLDDAAAWARASGVVLTPHTVAPLPAGLTMKESDLLLYGAFNLGFLAVSNKSRPFLEWWKGHLRRDCRRFADGDLFVDQRWCDLVPGLFDHWIVRDPGWNVAYWNLEARHVTGAPGTWRVDGRPLRFVHFSKFDPTRPALGQHPGVSEHPEVYQTSSLQELAELYAKELLREGITTCQRTPYGYAMSLSGAAMTRALRTIYREELIAAEARGEDLPDPFATDERNSFERWRRHAVTRGAVTHLVRRYRKAVRREGGYALRAVRLLLPKRRP